MSDAKTLVTLEEFLAMSTNARGERAEFVNGEIVQKALPGGKHGLRQANIVRGLASFHRKSRSDGTGGWWILTETSVLYTESRAVTTHDLVGWRRDRVPEEPLDYPVREKPDWACEVAVSTLRKDTRDVKRTLEIEGVPFYWVLDAANERLAVYERIDGHLVQTRDLFREDGKQRIPPFDAIEVSVGLLLGDDPED